jgi:hypothetical protein
VPAAGFAVLLDVHPFTLFCAALSMRAVDAGGVGVHTDLLRRLPTPPEERAMYKITIACLPVSARVA